MVYSLLMMSFCQNIKSQLHLVIMPKYLVPSHLVYVCCSNHNQEYTTHTHTRILSPMSMPIGKSYLSLACNKNKLVRALLQKDLTVISHSISHWSQFVNDITWRRVWLLPNRYLITNKVKEVTFKLIHRIYPAKSYIKTKFKLDIDENCTFCHSCPESVVHLFWFCPFVYKMWHDLCVFISGVIEEGFDIFWENVLFGLPDSNTHNKTHTYIINLIILMAKFHIHRSKYMGNKPSFSAFLNEMRQYIYSILCSPKLKAIRTVNVCTELNIFF